MRKIRFKDNDHSDLYYIGPDYEFELLNIVSFFVAILWIEKENNYCQELIYQMIQNQHWIESNQKLDQ